MKLGNFRKFLAAAVLAASVAGANAANVVNAAFTTAPSGTGNAVAIRLTMTGYTGGCSGFNISVYYDSSQLQWVSATDNTGQPGAGVGYTVNAGGAGNPGIAGGGGGTSNVHANILMVPASADVNMSSSGTNLVQLNFTQVSASTSILNNFFVSDANEIYDSSVQPIAHTYDYTALPVAVSRWSVE